jgi:type I restriction enzyme M protein
MAAPHLSAGKALPLARLGHAAQRRRYAGPQPGAHRRRPLRDFVDQKLLPYLRGFKQRADSPNTIEYKIGEIFGELKNKLKSGYNLREVIELIDTLRFNSQTEKHELSELYEAKIRKMGNAGRNGGEYYTPRPLIRAMLAVVQPRIGETIYDGALGSAGFLCESFTA